MEIHSSTPTNAAAISLFDADGKGLVQLTSSFCVPSADLLNIDQVPDNLETRQGRPDHAMESDLKIVTTNPPEFHFQWIGRPHLRQEWLDVNHKILRRDKYDRKASFMELYYDLIFVGVIALLGHSVRLQATLSVSFFVEFIACFHIWMETVFFLNRFDNEDGLSRILILLIMVGVVGMGIMGQSTNFRNGFGYAISFMWARTVIELMHLIALIIPTVRNFVLLRQAFFLFVQIFWISSLWAPSELVRLVLQFCGVGVGYVAPIIMSSLPRKFRIAIPLNLEHVVERFSLFSIIIIGETIVAIFFVESGYYIVNEYATTLLGLLLSFCLQWIFFDLENGHHGDKLEQHAFSRGWQSFIWIFSHIPADFAIICLAAGVWNVHQAYKRIEVVSINNSSCPQNITEPYLDPCNLDPFLYGRWILCVGAAASLLFISLNGAMHKRNGSGKIFSFKAIIRVVAVVVLGLIPLAGDTMSPLAYLGVCCGIYCAIVAVGLAHRKMLVKVGEKMVVNAL